MTGLALAGVGLVWLRDGPGTVATILGEDARLLASVLPKVAAGVLIAVLLPYFVTAEAIGARVGPARGWRGLALAGACGALTPGGPGVTLPLAGGLLVAGADRGAVVAFVTGWVLLGVNRILVWEMAFLPPDLIAFRIALCLPAPILAGLLARRFGA